MLPGIREKGQRIVMVFVISKIAWLLLEPFNLLVLLTGVCVVLLKTRAATWARRMLGALVLLVVFVGAVPVGHWMVTALENRFPVPVLPTRVDGVVVLGGAIHQKQSLARAQPVLGEAAERMTAFAHLGRMHPHARLVFAGGNGSLDRSLPPEAQALSMVLEQLGVDRSRVEVEDRSRNTFENAANAKALVQPQPSETWVLITSARHMPRAVGTFHQVGWNITPYPVDFLTDGSPVLTPHLHLMEGFSFITCALREYLGLAWYRVTGRIPEFLPGPGS